MVVPRLIILVWLTTFVLFDSIKFELIWSIPSKKLKRPASADERQVAKKSMIKNPGKENFFLNGRKIVLG
jgi:hypothetical protein